jgi:hypothetical protein
VTTAQNHYKPDSAAKLAGLRGSPDTLFFFIEFSQNRRRDFFARSHESNLPLNQMERCEQTAFANRVAACAPRQIALAPGFA